MLRDLPTELLPLTDEQQAIVELTRSFAEREIRPIAREVDEADIETPVGHLAQGGRGRADRLHAP